MKKMTDAQRRFFREIAAAEASGKVFTFSLTPEEIKEWCATEGPEDNTFSSDILFPMLREKKK